jgi:hypothetical protein
MKNSFKTLSEFISNYKADIKTWPKIDPDYEAKTKMIEVFIKDLEGFRDHIKEEEERLYNLAAKHEDDVKRFAKFESIAFALTKILE